MKKRIRFVSMMMAFVLATGCFAGCGKKGEEQKNAATDVEIKVWNAGWGTKHVDAWIEAFQEKHPEYNVFYTASANDAGLKVSYTMEDVDTTDIYITPKIYDTRYLEPLDDILDATVEGESKSIREKMKPGYLVMEEMDGHYYSLSTSYSIEGVVYNKQIFEEAGITQPPRTTDEWALVCGMLRDKKITPLAHFSPTGYYEYFLETWFAQYDGFDYYVNDFYKNNTKEMMLKKDGRYAALEAFEKILTPENTLQGSNTESHIAMQTKFLEGQCAMMISGSWLCNEMSMEDSQTENFLMMKMPVISNITDKLSSVKSESQLRKLITAIDNVTDGVESIEVYKTGENYVIDGKEVTAADWDYVNDARHTMSSNISAAGVHIPSYSNAKEGAKEFLKFIYSDEGIAITEKTMKTPSIAERENGEIDTEGWNAFNLNQLELIQDMKYGIGCDIMGRHKVFTYGGARSYGMAYSEFIPRFCATNEKDRMTANDIWDNMVKVINEQYDSVWMENIKKWKE